MKKIIAILGVCALGIVGVSAVIYMNIRQAHAEEIFVMDQKKAQYVHDDYYIKIFVRIDEMQDIGKKMMEAFWISNFFSDYDKKIGLIVDVFGSKLDRNDLMNLSAAYNKMYFKNKINVAFIESKRVHEKLDDGIGVCIKNTMGRIKTKHHLIPNPRKVMSGDCKTLRDLGIMNDVLDSTKFS